MSESSQPESKLSSVAIFGGISFFLAFFVGIGEFSDSEKSIMVPAFLISAAIFFSAAAIEFQLKRIAESLESNQD